MGETSDQIERHIQETRNDLGDNFSELEARAKTAVDWRAQFEQRPGTLLAVAFGGGVLLSALLPSRRSSGRRISREHRNTPPDREFAGPSSKAATPFDGTANKALETWDALKGALIGVATSKLSGFVEDLLPGFGQEFSKAQTGKNSDRSGASTFRQHQGQRVNGTDAD